jgi:hypothetical protein
MLAMVRIEAAEGPLHFGPRAHDRAIDVDGQARQLELRDRLDHEVVIELDQRREGGLGELLEPIADGMGRGAAGHATEAGDEPVAGEIAQMFEATRADVEQRHHQQRQPAPAVVARNGGDGATQAGHHITPVQISAHQLQAAARREILLHELDRQITLDHAPQAPYAQAHQRGLLELRDDMGMSALSIRWKAPLIHFRRSSLPSGISDQG